MGFDKAKVLRAAEKYLAQGKIPSAIQEYRQITEHDPGDFTALNMLGDLYARTSRNQEAIDCFTRIAEHYCEQGFSLKAIAMLKKIDRLIPGTPEIASQLAELYDAQGLVVEARAQYLLVADVYTRTGQSQKALDILRRVADLEPQNTEIRTKLAESFEREGLRTEAADAFVQAGSQLLARDRFDRAVESFRRALELVPNDRAALSGLLNAHVRMGTAVEAAESLERAVSEHPEDLNLLSMLAQAYVEAEDAGAAERVTSKLVEREPSNYQRFTEVARLYLKQSNEEEAVRLLSSITERMLTGREENELMELVNEVLARNPEHLEALRLLVRIHAWQRDDEKMRAALERLAEAAETAGNVEQQRYALAHLVRLVPDQTAYQEKLQALGGATEEDEENLPAYNFHEEPVPAFENALTTDEFAAETGAQEVYGEYEWNVVEPAAVSEPPQFQADPPSFNVDPSSSFADLNDWTDAETVPAFSEQTASAEHAAEFHDFGPGADFGGAQTFSGDGASSSAAPSNQADAMLRQELDSVDFYIAQGYTDIAVDTLNMLERQFGRQREIDARREKLGQAPAPAEVSEPPVPSPQTVEFTNFARYETAEEVPAVEANVDLSFAELTTPAATSVAQAEEAPRRAPAQAGIDPGLAAIFDEFRSEVEEEEPQPSDDDYETHYNLGLAYKEMDLLDEAIEEFQVAAALSAPADGTPRFLQCCNLLGHCFMQKEMPRVSVMWFKKGLGAPGHTEEEYQALRYELGTAYEQMGDIDKALEVFTEVYGINVSYRGIAAKLRELQSQKLVNGK